MLNQIKQAISNNPQCQKRPSKYLHRILKTKQVLMTDEGPSGDKELLALIYYPRWYAHIRKITLDQQTKWIALLIHSKFADIDASNKKDLFDYFEYIMVSYEHYWVWSQKEHDCYRICNSYDEAVSAMTYIIEQFDIVLRANFDNEADIIKYNRPGLGTMSDGPFIAFKQVEDKYEGIRDPRTEMWPAFRRLYPKQPNDIKDLPPLYKDKHACR